MSKRTSPNASIPLDFDEVLQSLWIQDFRRRLSRALQELVELKNPSSGSLMKISCYNTSNSVSSRDLEFLNSLTTSLLADDGDHNNNNNYYYYFYCYHPPPPQPPPLLLPPPQPRPRLHANRKTSTLNPRFSWSAGRSQGERKPAPEAPNPGTMIIETLRHVQPSGNSLRAYRI